LHAQQALKQLQIAAGVNETQRRLIILEYNLEVKCQNFFNLET